MTDMIAWLEENHGKLIISGLVLLALIIKIIVQYF